MTRVKVCGITRAEDALLAAKLGAVAIGFIFWPDSPRYVPPVRAREIVTQLPPFVVPVGVFVNQPAEVVLSIARLVRLGAVQLHGEERPEEYASLPVRVIKAVPLTTAADGEAAHAVPDRAMVLLDAHDPSARGGTGRTIDWNLAASVSRRRPVVLAGGLDAGNVAEAIATVSPYAIDVSSCVESSPGRKDPAKLRALFEAVGTL